MGTPTGICREPCPDQILDDTGSTFVTGITGGSIYHFLKGTINSPRGKKFLGGFQSLRMNSLKVGGAFAAWGALSSTFDCGMVYIRQKEDPWNAVISGTAALGFLRMRHGVRATARSAVAGALLLGLGEVSCIMLERWDVSPPKQRIKIVYDDPHVGGKTVGDVLGGLSV